MVPSWLQSMADLVLLGGQSCILTIGVKILIYWSEYNEVSEGRYSGIQVKILSNGSSDTEGLTLDTEGLKQNY